MAQKEAPTRDEKVIAGEIVRYNKAAHDLRSRNAEFPQVAKLLCDVLLANPKLSPAQAYVQIYCTDGQIPEHRAQRRANALLSLPRVKKYLAEGRAALAALLDISPEQVLAEERCIAFSDIRQAFSSRTVGGRTIVAAIPPDRLPRDIARAIASVDVIQDRDGNTIWRYKFWSKPDALERISRHLGLYEKDNEQRKIQMAQVFLDSIPAEDRLKIMQKLAGDDVAAARQLQ